VFTGVDPAEYANYQMFVEVMSVFSLFVLLPLMTNVLKWHETTINVIICFCVTSGAFLMASVTKLWPGRWAVENHNTIFKVNHGGAKKQ